MNITENYIYYIKQLEDTQGVAAVITALDSLDPRAASFADSVQSVKDTFDAQADNSEESQKVTYMLGRIVEYNQMVFDNWDHWRQQEYPSIGDQLDMLWHGMDDGTIPKVTSFYDAIKEVKDKYPKS